MKLNYYSLSAIAHKTLKGDLGYTSGVFDLFHQGHKLYLEKCKTLCDTLIIGVDNDSLVKTNKGEDRPFETIEKRIANVVALGLADEIFIKTGSSEDIFETIRLNKYFVPKNRSIAQRRTLLLERLSIEAIVLPYTEGISITLISQLDS
ncbi:hypothetical protein FA287_11165 [Pseudomonas aeruginosa]|uniref:adenylyltransferase/cytidyltransferase family protein n=1 Tax=Pseudomonas aeruginosa TaxID=287 RepID=UPI000E21A31F|nr:adenylyltransferase/cytidyltransferase family protein [Pseudomonas aeruginosa]KAA5576267.1 adenylyltransferase/cytidyltransferase family protein [Pseudomonas aeruginosa]MCO2789269.1 hypothetical protein [Pseudomonas aeruginosa]RUB29420.1 hypothetical protein IPC1438_15155 [Pseudomonas aeruginosa]HEJ2970528.1 adenylyltransferase/cytidyltransferase family protein [Pseudomonas aeruginosa]